MIMTAASVLTTLAGLLAAATFIFVVEIAASFFFRERNAAPAATRRGRVAVLVPAHDEAACISQTLNSIRTQLSVGDRLVVVADNCSDNTAEIAIKLGAEVSVRSDLSRIGKGYALDWGLRFLEQDPPDTVIVIDADCILAPLTIERMAEQSQRTERPVQALYLMTSPSGSRVNHQVAEFAWRVKNLVRPLGLSALGLPCQLMGSGMAFPWMVLRSVDLANGHIVEDLKLGLDLARTGFAPAFCPAARVSSTFPNSAKGARTQRERWEHGQLTLAFKSAVLELWEAIVRRNFGLYVLASDLLVPPLSLFTMALVITLLASALLAFFAGHSLPLAIVSTSVVGFGLAIVLAWMAYGRAVLPAKSLALIPAFLFVKLRHYASALLRGGTSQWIRTDRG
jgi:cellulose synthase/poly-beta-1,6-N-acetylglucosamine synthase-like glycosyltransferase